MTKPDSDTNSDTDCDVVSRSKPSGKGKKRNPTKPKSQVPKAKGAKGEEPKSSSGEKWQSHQSLWLLNAVYEQIQDGNGNDGGISTEGWNKVLAGFNIKFDVGESKARLKNHIQVLKKTCKALEKIQDSSGGPGVDEVSGGVNADKEWWDHWIASGNDDAKPIRRNNGFPLYQAVLTIMPAKCNRANGKYGSGTQTQKEKRKSPEPEELDGEDSSGGPRRARDPSELNLPNLSDPPSPAASPPRSPERFPVSSQRRVAGLKSAFKPAAPERFARERRIIERQLAEELASPELDFVRSKRDADGSEESKPKRSRMSAAKTVANSIDRAVDLEEDRSTSQLAIAKLKLEKFPKREAAMRYFGKHASKHFTGKDLITAAKLLKCEDNASFFLLLEGDLKWEWLKDEAQLAGGEK